MTIFTSCNTSQTSEKSFNPKIINAKFPLKLTEIDWGNPNNIFRENDEKEAKIEETIKEYYREDNLPDKLLENYHISTIRLKAEFQTIYLILLRHYPTGYTNGKVLFYENETREFIPAVFNFNLFALYNNLDGKLKASNLKEQFKVETPEIQLVDVNGDNIKDFQFTRLAHNGTYNAIQTTVVSVKNMKIDTLIATENPIGFEP
ncbi:hypothetical protein [Emticicia sp. C21]|uniref:hypothetical protein n=1 Tax=Emticicia sp. C21 TaxID=2302915 RepID=UPI0011C1AE39|nr:hypothetical protein [Emticicia sp. C21]